MMNTKWMAGLSALALGLSAACSSGGGNDASGEQPLELGAALTVAITDAPADELESFTVEVTEFRLTTASGATVGVLPAPVDVDLVTLLDASQILNSMNVPAGAYAAAEVTFDFTNAEAYLVDEDVPATIVDSDGLPLTGEVTLPIDVSNLLAPVIGRHHVLELDFDLNHSVMVDVAANEVMVEPAIVMRVDRTDPKELRFAGELVSVDPASDVFVFGMRRRDGQLAEVSVAVDASTVYQVDGVPFEGADGLAALAAKPAGTWVQGHGSVDPALLMLRAAYVEAGTGTRPGAEDIVDGHVIGRVENGDDVTLMVHGFADDGTHHPRNATFTVDVNAALTKVVMRGSASAYDTDLLNIGQHVRVFGTLSAFAMDASSASDVVRVEQVTLAGIANAAVANEELELDLARVDRRDAASFLWSEGGATPADPDALIAAVGSLAGGLPIDAGSPVLLRGLFSDVDDDGPDFDASSVADLSAVASRLGIVDLRGGFDVVTTVERGAVRFAITGTPGRFEAAWVEEPGMRPAPLPRRPRPAVTGTGNPGVYSLRVGGRGSSIHVFRSFAEYARALDAALARGAKLHHFGASGDYDAATNTMAADTIFSALD